eukprot:6884573-Alexandrium_andersonii.AAC.1
MRLKVSTGVSCAGGKWWQSWVAKVVASLHVAWAGGCLAQGMWKGRAATSRALGSPKSFAQRRATKGQLSAGRAWVAATRTGCERSCGGRRLPRSLPSPGTPAALWRAAAPRTPAFGAPARSGSTTRG